MEKFQKLALLPNVFEQDGLKERTVLAFCKTQEQKDEAMNAGANLVGGIEIIKEIEVSYACTNLHGAPSCSCH